MIGPILIGIILIGPFLIGPFLIGPFLIGPILIGPILIGPILIGPCYREITNFHNSTQRSDMNLFFFFCRNFFLIRSLKIVSK